MSDNNDQNADRSREIENAQLFIRDADRNFRLRFGLSSDADGMHLWLNAAMAEFDKRFSGRQLPDKLRIMLYDRLIRRAVPNFRNRNLDNQYLGFISN